MPRLIQTTALTKISQLKKSLRIIQGGTNASKTFSIVAYLVHTAQANPNLLISIVSETMPHLKKGSIRDFQAIMKAQNYWDDSRWSKVESIYTFSNGSQIEFFSADQPGKVHGPRRDILFINECNNIPYTVYDALAIRTRKLVIVDYNPIGEFWIHEEVIPHEPHDFLKLTYLDNEAISDLERIRIEAKKRNTNWWRIYGLGETGIKEGQIYTGWQGLDDIPPEAELVRRGNDFGFTNDPSAVVDIYKWNNALIFDEVLYEYGQSNKQIANAIRESEGLDLVDAENHFVGQTKILTIADSAEPKSIEEIKKYGVKITGAVKGAGSVNFGIEKIQDEEVYVTKRSTNIWKESRNYLWRIDKRTNKPLNVPEDNNNHAMDAVRYGVSDLKTRHKARVFTEKPSGW